MDEFKLNQKRNEFGEYVIQCWRDGKRFPDGDYFTDDLRDARETLKLLRADEEAFHTGNGIIENL